MKRKAIFSIFLLITAISLPAVATPDFVTYSGRLSDGTGMGQSALMTLTFGIWDAGTGGTSHWEATFENVAVEDGYFSVILGEGEDPVTLEAKTATEAFQDLDEAWLSVKIGDDPVLSPRQPIGSVPYAARAQTLDGLNLDGLDGRFVNEGQEGAVGSEMLAENLEIGGNVGIGGDLNIGGEIVQNGVPSRTTSAKAYYVDDDGSNETGDGSAGNPWQTVQHAIYQLPQQVNHSIKIHVAEGVYTTNCIIWGFSGRGSITIMGDEDNPESRSFQSNQPLDYAAMIVVSNCSNLIQIYGIEFSYLDGAHTQAIRVNNSINFTIKNCIIRDFSNLETADEKGIQAVSSNVFVNAVEFRNNDVCLHGQQTSQIASIGSTGSNNSIALRSVHASVVIANGDLGAETAVYCIGGIAIAPGNKCEGY